MKILILSDNFYPYHKGGGDIVPFLLAKQYLEEGNQVLVFCAVNDRKLAGREILEGMKIFRFYSHYHIRWRAYISILNISLIKQLKKILLEERPDIVHAHNLHQNISFYSLRLIKKLKIPLVLTLHDCTTFCYKKFDCYLNTKDLSLNPQYFYKHNPLKCLMCQRKRYFPLRNFLLRYFLKFSDKVFAVSQEHQKVLKENKVRCDNFIYNGIDVNNFNYIEKEKKYFLEKFNLEGKKIILGAGRLHPAKGFEYVVRALPKIREKLENVVFVLASQNNNYGEYLSKLAKELNIKDNFLITGWLRKENLKATFFSSNVVVYPSICFDTFGLVNLEAMAARKPVITTCFGGSKEVVLNGITGYVINPYNAKDLSEKILKILLDDKLAQEMGKQGYLRLKEKFTIEKSADEYLKNFKALIK